MKKFAAPIIITILIVISLVGNAATLFVFEGVPLWAKIIGLTVSAVLTVLGISVLVSRIKEIKKGENDDLSKY